VLYLAEVQKKSGVFGSGKAGLKLLAQQRSEHNWSPASGDEIPFDDATTFGAGVLVMVEISPNKQVQGAPKEAGPQLVKILQGFSRFQEKTKTQEEEIDQWKASLTYQAEELNRRETEIQGREEQVEQIQEQLDALATRKAEIEAETSALNGARQELENSKQELEAAWRQFQGERENFAQQTEQAASLDADQANSLKEWLDYLAEVVTTSGDSDELIATIEAQIEAQRQTCRDRREMLNHDHEQLGTVQADRDRLQGELEATRTTLSELRAEASRAEAGRSSQQAVIDTKQQLASSIAERLADVDSLTVEISQLSINSGSDDSDLGVNLGELERLPLNELQQKVRQLQDELEKGFRFVSDQEEELTLQCMDLNELETKLARANEAERAELQTELADSHESFKFLNQTLVGQRRNLRKQERVMNLHQVVLWRRLGNPPEATSSGGGTIDTSAIMAQLRLRKGEQTALLATLEAEIAELQAQLASLDLEITAKQQEIELHVNQVNEQTEALEAATAALERTTERIEVLSGLLDTIEAQLAEFAAGCDSLKEGAAVATEVKQSQENAIAQLQELVNGLTG
jgi:chromosome segregation ATPase